MYLNLFPEEDCIADSQYIYERTSVFYMFLFMYLNWKKKNASETNLNVAYLTQRSDLLNEILLVCSLHEFSTPSHVINAKHVSPRINVKCPTYVKKYI